ncbi:MAG: DNA-3-methyladenine glycosylase family protein [Desulfitobacteriia bacterium]|jgi:DNA-3-methyladenine glycosylase II
MNYFEYGDTEINYLKSKDKKLAAVIDKIGPIKREVIPDLFTALVNSIISQQISAKAFATVWQRLLEKVGEINPQALNSLPVEELQGIGITMRKARYIKNIADQILSRSFTLDDLPNLSDGEIIKRLTSLPGVGVWTAEMLMIFSLQRKNILSWNDLAIRRGIMTLYRHRELSKERFERYRHRYSPYCSVASLYLWEISKGE